MVPSNSHVLAIVEQSDLPAFEVAFKAQQAEDRPAGILGTSALHLLSCCLGSFSSGQAASSDPPELAETVASVFGTNGLPLPQSPASAGFVYRDDCRSSLTFASQVMFQEDIADAVNGVRYGCYSFNLSRLLTCLLHTKSFVAALSMLVIRI
jgi:hypothetical protein